ncbi:SsrA-binding protein [Mesonia aestuariivivens]|uniref:SsrA-binding protein n=1 Tax=Mesonia aestuariivivens TaxID=2796128 RepID=A0ABS6VZK4_9FLAO|nr:SsrA-binding protein [Mesonia aestuariivivens]MBW2961025.1 SsrA-binding protein [Mesonia aestuariivivens]
MGLKSSFFKGLSKLNKIILPNYTKKGLELENATKFQLAIIGWKAWVTKHATNHNQKLLGN